MRVRSLLGIIAAAALAACAGSAADLEANAAGGYFISPHGEPFSFDPGGSGLARWYNAADADDSGRLDRGEFQADGDRFFGMVDADQDGAATSPEVSTFRSREAPRLENMLAYIPVGGGGPRRAAPTSVWHPTYGFIQIRRGAATPVLLTLLSEREPILASDTDFNRRVTKAEFDAASAERFARLDSDGDGALTLAALRSHLQP